MASLVEKVIKHITDKSHGYDGVVGYWHKDVNMAKLESSRHLKSLAGNVETYLITGDNSARILVRTEYKGDFMIHHLNENIWVNPVSKPIYKLTESSTLGYYRIDYKHW